MAVGATTIFGQNKFADRLGRTRQIVCPFQQPAYGLHASFNRLAYAASRLNGHKFGHRFPRVEGVQLMRFSEGLDLIAFAPQANHHITGNVRMPGDAGQHALQELLRLAGIHGTPRLVRKRDYSIDVGEITAELRGAKLVSHIVGDRSGTINARDDGNIIARSRSPARTGVALEVTHLLWRMEIHRAGIDAKLVITPEIFEHEVVGMNMFPGTNMASREANDLAVLFYRCSVSKLQQGDFMAGRDVLANAQMKQVVADFLAGF